MVSPRTAPAQPGAPEKLLERYAGGDDAAFRELVGMYEDTLFAFLARLTGDAHLAEDVFQQSFLKAAQKASVFDSGRASFSAWLFRIARNTAIDEMRRRGRVQPHAGVESGMLGDTDTGELPPLDRLAREEQAERIRTAVGLLPEAQREAFLLREEGDLDFAAIGKIQGCGRETAKSRFRLAVNRLRELLGVQRDGEKGGAA